MIHNVDIALSAMIGEGYVLTGNITAIDICDGHREKTLSLLWQILHKFQKPPIANLHIPIVNLHIPIANYLPFRERIKKFK
jgi:hypothetical protein